jgi:hypothetical protein
MTVNFNRWQKYWACVQCCEKWVTTEYSGEIRGSRNNNWKCSQKFSQRFEQALPLSTLDSKNANSWTQRNTNDSAKHNVIALEHQLLQGAIHSFQIGTVIWSKTNFGPTVHHHPQSSPLLCACTVPSTNASWKSCLWGCSAPHVILSYYLNCQNGGFSVLPGKQKSREGGSCCFGQKQPGEKGSVRQGAVVLQEPLLLSPKFGAKSSHCWHPTVKYSVWSTDHNLLTAARHAGALNWFNICLAVVIK